MADLLKLAVQKRDDLSKKGNKGLRKSKSVPCVFYNAKGENIAVKAELLALEKAFAQTGRTTVFNLEIDDNGKKQVFPVLFWAIQYHPLRNIFSHIDFYGVDVNQEIKIKVPLVFTGTAKGVKAGGKLTTYREHVYLKGKPLVIPSKIEINMTDFEIGKNLRVKDLIFENGVHAIYDDNFAILSIVSKGADDAKETK